MKIRRITPGNPTSGKRCRTVALTTPFPGPMAGCAGTAGVSGAKITVICKGGSHGILEDRR